MKKLITFLSFICLLTQLGQATVRTVSNDPLGGAQYNTLQAAFNACSNGDTMLIEGTNIPYNLTTCTQRWNKSLVVIGIGFNPQKSNPRRVLFSATTCESWILILHSGGNGSKFYGIEFLTSSFAQTLVCEGNPSNYTFDNCKINGHFGFNNNTVSNFTFTNCIFDRDNDNCVQLADNGTPVVSNILFQNCVFDGYVKGSGNLYTTVIFDHCLFLTTTSPFNTLQNAVISNNIFMNAFPTGTTNATFTNNISRIAGTLPPTANSGVNNIEATNPLLVTYTFGQLYSTAHDYALQAGSPAIGTGLEGSDIGVHGGAIGFSETGEVRIAPVMRSVLITNPMIPSNGTLQVDIHASKPSIN